MIGVCTMTHQSEQELNIGKNHGISKLTKNQLVWLCLRWPQLILSLEALKQLPKIVTQKMHISNEARKQKNKQSNKYLQVQWMTLHR